MSVLTGLFILFLLAVIANQIEKYFYTPTIDTTEYDHHIHVPIQSVPQEYYLSYSQYLLSDRWKELRSTVLDRDSHICVDCGSTSYLQVHHIHYDGIETMTFHTDQLVTLCASCHNSHHSR